MKSVNWVESLGHGGVVQRSKQMSQQRGITIAPIESLGAEIRGTVSGVI